jgi:BioD-like phosphotransacetylase family protein
LADRLFAKVLNSESALNQPVGNILIGAMSSSAVMQNPLFKKPGKLVITSGDRSDMILAALETGSAGIVLTNNLLPPSNIIAKAAEKNVPLLGVPADTYQTAKEIENLEPLLTQDDFQKFELLSRMVGACPALKEILQ